MSLSWKSLVFTLALFASSVASAMSLQAGEVTLGNLWCGETEDSGADECLVKIYVDDRLYTTQKFSMTNGNIRDLRLTLTATRSVRVALFDEDWPDSDDHLGTIEISATAGGAFSKDFTGDGAHYRLDGHVRSAPAVVKHRIKLNWVECITTEDSGTDELIVRVVCDGQVAYSKTHNMKNGSFLPLNLEFTYLNQAEIKLIEYDFPDANDHLGTTRLGKSSSGERTDRFDNEGANYKVNYRIIAER